MSTLGYEDREDYYAQCDVLCELEQEEYYTDNNWGLEEENYYFELGEDDMKEEEY